MAVPSHMRSRSSGTARLNAAKELAPARIQTRAARRRRYSSESVAALRFPQIRQTREDGMPFINTNVPGRELEAARVSPFNERERA